MGIRSVARHEKEGRPAPAAVPILSSEEANSLNESLLEEIKNRFSKRYTVFREVFFTTSNCTSNINDTNNVIIEQTSNWRFVFPGEKTLGGEMIAKKESAFFDIKSKIPLEYHFLLPLHENTMYCYTLGCRAKGNGIITLAAADSEKQKEFIFDSDSFKYISYELGEGRSFKSAIIPSISFQGNLQIESIVLYQNVVNENRTVCRGIIEDISDVPDINKSDYPDCFYSALFAVKDILDGEPIPEKVQLLIPAFMDNIVHPLSKIMQKGDYQLSIRPFSLATEHEQSIEQVDELELYEYTPYILVDAFSTSVSTLTKSNIPILEGGKMYVSPYETPLNSPLEDKYLNDSQRIIAQDLKKMNEIIASADDADSINSAFQQSWAEKQKKYDNLPGTNLVWANEQNSYFALPKNWRFIHPIKITQDNLDALNEIKQFLLFHGIHFILQVIPDYKDIAALALNPEFQKYGDQQSAVVVKQLLEKGIEAQYISDEIVKHAFDYERLYDYPGDPHPDLGTTEIMTSVMAERLLLYNFQKQLDPNLFSKKQEDAFIGIFFFWPQGVNIGEHKPNERVQVPVILYNEKKITPDPESKIFVWGNSFIGTPFGNAYISYLSERLLYKPYSRSMGGHGAVTGLIVQLLLDSKKLLKGRTVAILPIGISYLAEQTIRIPNLAELDTSLKILNESKFISTVSIRDYCSSIFSSSTNLDFVPRNKNINRDIKTFIGMYPNAVLLSESQSFIEILIPQDINPKTIEISACPIRYDAGASFYINDTEFQIHSNEIPKWESILFEVKENQRKIVIRLNENKSMILLGNISFYN